MACLLSCITIRAEFTTFEYKQNKNPPYNTYRNQKKKSFTPTEPTPNMNSPTRKHPQNRIIESSSNSTVADWPCVCG